MPPPENAAAGECRPQRMRQRESAAGLRPGKRQEWAARAGSIGTHPESVRAGQEFVIVQSSAPCTHAAVHGPEPPLSWTRAVKDVRK